MKPETEQFLANARSFLAKSEGMLHQNWPDEAGRAAYLATFHAAQATIFEISGRVVKTHSGVRGEFGRLVKDIAGFDPALARFLGQAYKLKASADYGTDPASVVTHDEARDAIPSARRFVEHVLLALPSTD